MTTSVPLTQKILTPLAKNALMPSAVSVATSGTTALIFSNKEMEEIIKVVNSLEE